MNQSDELSDTYIDSEDSSLSDTYYDAYNGGEDEEDQMEGSGDERANNDVEHPPSHFYTLGEQDAVHIRRFNVAGATIPLNFRNLDQCRDIIRRLVEIFEDAFTQIFATANLEPNDQVGVQIAHPALDKNIYIPFQLRRYFSAEMVVDWLEKVLQSHQELSFDETFTVKLITVRPPAGRGKARCVNLKQHMAQHECRGGRGSSCFIHITKKGDICCARALVVARARHEKDKPETRWNDIRRCEPRGYLQKRTALELMRSAGLEHHRDACGPAELLKLQDAIPDYQIKVFDKDHCMALTFIGRPEREKVLHLYLSDNHYDVICSVPAFLHKSYWCELCNKGYDCNSYHRCSQICQWCYQKNACPLEQILRCNDCNRWFQSRRCFENHKEVPTMKGGAKRQKLARSVCQRFQCCPKAGCGKRIENGDFKNHKCGHFDCPVCHEYVQKEGHQCYIQPLRKDNDDDDDDDDVDPQGDSGRNDHSTDAQQAIKEKNETVPTYLFYDFETQQETVIGENQYGPILKHVPNFCISHKVCDECRNQPLGHCVRCSQNRMLFEGPECVNKFCEYLFSGRNKGVTAIAHNSKGFDGQFILRYLQEQGYEPSIVPKGLELMCITAGGVRIIDSLNFMPMPLSAMPRAFELEELAKGYFPFLFNTAENQNYVGPYPDACFYSPATMKESARKNFYTWYNLRKDEVFNFREEMEKYCESDVNILRRACLKFRDSFMNETQICPFTKSLTIASACNLVFRTHFLERDTIGIVPYGGYRRNEMQSVIAVKWLKWISYSERKDIRHARNMGEQRIGLYKVDGICQREVFEFYGCYWHGCVTCMKKRTRRTLDSTLNAQEAYERTVERERYIVRQGYIVRTIWECQLARQFRLDPTMQDFFNNISIVEPLNPRDAFYGGRTNAIKLLHQIKKDFTGAPLEHIQYTDICSLYPYVNKYGTYPLGHPTIITENFLPTSALDRPYQGLIRSKILPPRRLFHPLLPYRSKGKLLFPLCRTCADTRQTSLCLHSDDERSIVGTFVTLEVYKALELGYKLLETYEVWHYKEMSTYDPVTKQGGLFTTYINKFMCLKQEADGWPSWVATEDDKRRYIDEYEAREGIRLDPNRIKKNPGLRALAKLMLNSFLVFDPANVIHAVNYINDNLVSVTHNKECDFVEVMPNTNVVLAAFTTSQARLHLYSFIEKLGERCFYFDTDSVIFKTDVHVRDQYRVPIGSYLGCMADELKDFGEGSYIDTFVSTGPKSYAYRVWSTRDEAFHYVTKVRGFTLSSMAAKQINFDNLKKVVKSYVKNNCRDELNIVSSRIERTGDRNVVTKYSNKKFRLVYDKRVVKENYCTFPFGY